MTGARPEAATVCEAGCTEFSDECPFCVMEGMVCTDAAPSASATDAVKAAITERLDAGFYDPALRETSGSIGVEFQGSNRQRRKPRWVAQLWNSRLGFPRPVLIGGYPTKEAAAEAYDVACLAMGLPARNYPDREHSASAIATVRAHLERFRKPA